MISRRTNSAFTLLELMLGIIISTMILTACAMVFSTAMRSWEQGSEARNTLQVGQTISDLIERHLRSAMAPEKREGGAVFLGEDLSDGGVSGHKLTLVSSAPGRFPRSSAPTDSCEIDFCFDPTKEDGLTMRIDASPDDDPAAGGQSLPLSKDVVGFQVQYFDGEDWVDEWDDEKLPVAVEFTLAIARRPLRPGETPADLGAEDVTSTH
ncbi:hypothetical protein LLG95_07815, partial [bacterium]|nr:hypothetical protein [bacterium]